MNAVDDLSNPSKKDGAAKARFIDRLNRDRMGGALDELITFYIWRGQWETALGMMVISGYRGLSDRAEQIYRIASDFNQPEFKYLAAYAMGNMNLQKEVELKAKREDENKNRDLRENGYFEERMSSKLAEVGYNGRRTPAISSYLKKKLLIALENEHSTPITRISQLKSSLRKGEEAFMAYYLRILREVM